jgi:bromodomain and WD repeat domain-containing protein 1/3
VSVGTLILFRPSGVPENSGEALPVLEEEIQSILYQPTIDDWPNNDRDAVTSHILAGLSKVMELAIAEPFLVPVDLNVYPTYAVIVEYPIDLSTIKARFENRFYRRVTAAQFDMRHLATNAEKFNERHSVIVKHARILTELCLRIIKQCTSSLDVTAVYHQLVDSYDSTDTEVDVEILPSSSRMLRSLPTRYLRHASDWKCEAKILFQAIWDCEDSVPFRTPVNNLKYTGRWRSCRERD